MITDDLLNLNPESYILCAYKSDHNIIKLSLKLSSSVQGKGSWKRNNELLKYKELINLIKDEIKLAKETYALPIYNPENIHTIDELNLQLMIPDSLFLNTLLCQIRGIIISFSKKVAKESREEEKELSLKIEKLTKELDNVNLEQQVREKETENLNTINKQYQKLRERRMKGHQIRSRSELTANWENPLAIYAILRKRNI